MGSLHLPVYLVSYCTWYVRLHAFWRKPKLEFWVGLLFSVGKGLIFTGTSCRKIRLEWTRDRFFFWYTSITGEPTIIVMRSQCGVSTQGNTWFLGTSWVLIACNICPPVIGRYGGNVLGIKVVWGVSPAAGRSLRYIVVWRETEVGLCGAITLWRVSLGSTIWQCPRGARMVL